MRRWLYPLTRIPIAAADQCDAVRLILSLSLHCTIPIPIPLRHLHLHFSPKPPAHPIRAIRFTFIPLRDARHHRCTAFHRPAPSLADAWAAATCCFGCPFVCTARVVAGAVSPSQCLCWAGVSLRICCSLFAAYIVVHRMCSLSFHFDFVRFVGRPPPRRRHDDAAWGSLCSAAFAAPRSHLFPRITHCALWPSALRAVLSHRTRPVTRLPPALNVCCE